MWDRKDMGKKKVMGERKGILTVKASVPNTLTMTIQMIKKHFL